MTESTFTPVHGERHVTRDGRVTDGPVFDMRLTGRVTKLPFIGAIDAVSESWAASGCWRSNGEESPYDLVAVYVPPPEPKYVPFERSDLLSLIGRLVRDKDWSDDTAAMITDAYGAIGVVTIAKRSVPPGVLFNGYEFVDLQPDGSFKTSPCGKVAP